MYDFVLLYCVAILSICLKNNNDIKRDTKQTQQKKISEHEQIGNNVVSTVL